MGERDQRACLTGMGVKRDMFASARLHELQAFGSTRCPVTHALPWDERGGFAVSDHGKQLTTSGKTIRAGHFRSKPRRMSPFRPDALQALQQHRNVILHDALERIVVDAEVAVDQAIARGDDHAAGSLRSRLPDVIRNAMPPRR